MNLTSLRHLLLAILRKPCPFKDIEWRNIGMAPGDCYHDRFEGRCRVCGGRHRSELGFYGRGSF